MHAHASTAGVSRVHTRPSCSWCYVRSSTHRRTQNRHGGACRPHKCACVRDEFMPLCLLHVHAYVNIRCAQLCTYTFTNTRARCAAMLFRSGFAGSPLVSFRFDKAHKNERRYFIRRITTRKMDNLSASMECLDISMERDVKRTLPFFDFHIKT